jgi:two-component system, chemotaxis family, chemotaxis protein CheY
MMNRSKVRILIVDDNEMLRTVLRRMMESLGFLNVHDAEDGEAALQKVAALDFDVVLTDWQMPRMDGITLLRRLRSCPATARLPVVVTSGSLSFERIVEACDAGANGVLAKPFAPELLERQILRVVGADEAALEVAAG